MSTSSTSAFSKYVDSKMLRSCFSNFSWHSSRDEKEPNLFFLLNLPFYLVDIHSPTSWYCENCATTFYKESEFKRHTCQYSQQWMMDLINLIHRWQAAIISSTCHSNSDVAGCWWRIRSEGRHAVRAWVILHKCKLKYISLVIYGQNCFLTQLYSSLIEHSAVNTQKSWKLESIARRWPPKLLGVI